MELAAADAPTVDTIAEDPAEWKARAAELDAAAEQAGGFPTALTFAPPEPPARTTGWRHLREELWPRDRITVAPWNPKIRRMPRDSYARLVAVLRRYGLAGTLNVRAEDGLLIGASQRFTALCEIIDRAFTQYEDDADALEAELRRLGVPGGLFPVSPILGMPDAIAAAFSIALNNREAQGDFDPMGLAEALSLIDADGLDLTDTGFTLEEAESLLTWEPDDTRNGGAKAAGGAPSGASANDRPAAGVSGKRRRAGEKDPARFADADDYTLAARALYRLADAEPSSGRTIRAAALAMRKEAAQLRGADPALEDEDAAE